jgi:hypothetical protein
MELDDLRQRWQELDRKLDASIRLNTRLLHGSILGKAATALKRQSRLVLAGLLIDLIAALWLGSFLARHVEEPRFLVPGGLLHLGILALIIAAVHQLAAIARIDYAAPIVAIQKQLEALRVERIGTVKWTLLLSPLAWTPLFIVAMKGFFDVDVYTSFGTAWVAANVVFGLVAIPVGLWICRHFAGRVERSPFLRQLMRDIGGQNLAAATDFLLSLAQLDEEGQTDGLR